MMSINFIFRARTYLATSTKILSVRPVRGSLPVHGLPRPVHWANTLIAVLKVSDIKNGRPAGRPFFYIRIFQYNKKVFAQCTGLGNPCTGKEPCTGRTESILVEVAKYVRGLKMKFIDTICNKMST